MRLLRSNDVIYAYKIFKRFGITKSNGQKDFAKNFDYPACRLDGEIESRFEAAYLPSPLYDI